MFTYLRIVVYRAQELCESRGGCPGLPVLMSLMVSRALSTMFTYLRIVLYRAQELCENRGGRPGPPRPNEPYGFYGRKTTLNYAHAFFTVCS